MNNSTSPYILTNHRLRELMWSVAVALLPALFLLSFFEGARWLSNALISVIAAMFFEALFLYARSYRLRPVLDGSITITALLITLALPQSAPLWLLLTANFLAVVFGKQLYGGLGMNIFNPAMFAFAFCLVSFPAVLSAQPAIRLDFWSLFSATPDVVTAATVLDHNRSLRLAGKSLELVWNWQQFSVNCSYLLTAAWLAFKRFLDGKITFAVLCGAVLTSLIFNLFHENTYLPTIYQLNSGAIILGACFIATDPTTAATTVRGRWIYGICIGALTICIRNIGNFPDGVAFAVLFSNALVPLIDPLTRPNYR